MKRAAVIGWPIAHSRSPMIHGYWLERYGIDGAYTKEAVRPEDLRAFLDSLQARGFAGCNVTVPHKEAVYEFANVKDASARAVGAANTLWFEDGKLMAANTDTYGFMTNLVSTVPDWSSDRGSVVILGAGGAARAVVYGFIEAGARDVRIFNRSRARAEQLAHYFGDKISVHDWDDRNAHVGEASIVVNTTTLGMNGQGETGIDFSGAGPNCVAADLVYVPLETAFLSEARYFGLRTVGGLGMLLHQAVPGFEKWFGIRPEVTNELYALIASDIGGS